MGEEIVKAIIKYGIAIGVVLFGLGWLLVKGIVWLTKHIQIS